jgi:hypothetical protein
MAKYSINRVSQKASSDLPAPMCREIGRIMVRWAHLESHVQGLVWLLLELDAPKGRIAVRDPRVSEKLDMIRELTALRGMTLDLTLFKSIRTRAEELSRTRDLVAHGLWVYIESHGEWRVQDSRGHWPKDPALVRSGAPQGSRRIETEAVLMTVDKLISTVANIKALFADIKTLQTTVLEHKL